MIQLSIPSAETLAKGRTRTVPGLRRGVRIECASGRLWVTQEGRADDWILEAGESLSLHGPGAIVIEALESACVSCGAPADYSATRS